MASTTGSSLHNGVDVEKTAGVHHAANGAHGQHGVTGVSTGSPAYASQEGGAPFNLRNITPGGHPLDRVRPCSSTEPARSLDPFPNILTLADFPLPMTHRASPRSRPTTVASPTLRPWDSAVSPSRRLCSRSSTVSRGGASGTPWGEPVPALAVLPLVVAASTLDERVAQRTDTEDDALAVKTRGVTVPNVVVGPVSLAFLASLARFFGFRSRAETLTTSTSFRRPCSTAVLPSFSQAVSRASPTLALLRCSPPSVDTRVLTHTLRPTVWEFATGCVSIAEKLRNSDLTFSRLQQYVRCHRLLVLRRLLARLRCVTSRSTSQCSR